MKQASKRQFQSCCSSRVIISLVILLGSWCFCNPLQGAVKYWIGPEGGQFANNSHWSSSSNGLNDATAPSLYDDAVFDANVNTSCIIDAYFRIDTLDFRAGYGGTVEVTGNVNLRLDSGLVMTGGNFLFGGGNLDNYGPITVTGGHFRAPAGQTLIKKDVTITGDSFDAQGGTFYYYDLSIHLDMGTSGNNQLYNLVLTSATFYDLTLDSNVVIAGNLIIEVVRDVKGPTYEFQVLGDIQTTLVNEPEGSTAKIAIVGTGNQTISAGGGSGALFNVVVNKPSGTLILEDQLTVSGIRPQWEHLRGVMDPGQSLVTMYRKRNTDHLKIIPDSSGNCRFNDLKIDLLNYIDFHLQGDLSVTGNLEIGQVDQMIDSGNVLLSGNLITSNSAGMYNFSTIYIRFVGDGNQFMESTIDNGRLPNIAIEKTGGTLFMHDSYQSQTGVWHYTSGNIDASASLLTVVPGNNPSDFTLGTSDNMHFYNLSLNPPSYRGITFDTANVFVDGNLELISLTSVLTTFHVQGNVSINDDSISFGTTGGLSFEGSSEQELYCSSEGAINTGNITILKSGNQVTLMSNVRLDSGSTNQLYIEEGILDLYGHDLSATKGFTINNGGAMRWNGDETLSNLPVLSGNTRIIYSGNGNGLQDTYNLTSTLTSFENLVIDARDEKDIFAFQLTPTISGNVEIQKGFLDLNGHDFVSGGQLALRDGGYLRHQGQENITSSIQLHDPGSAVIYTGDGDGVSDTWTLSTTFTSPYSIWIDARDGAMETFVPGMSYTLSGNLVVISGRFELGVQNLTTSSPIVVAGTLVQSTGDVSTSGLSIQQTGDYLNTSTGNLTLGADGVQNEGYLRLDSHGFSSGNNDDIMVSSNVIGVQRPWSGNGSFALIDLWVRDMGGNLSVYDSTNVGNNTWSFDLPSLAYYFWDGEAGDGLWNTANNWSFNTVPSGNGLVFFDGTSSQPALLDGDATIHSMLLAQGYQGNLNLGSGNLNVESADLVVYGGQLVAGTGSLNLLHNMRILAGNVMLGSGNTELLGNLLVDGGIFSANTSNMSVGGNWLISSGFAQASSNQTQLSGDFQLDSGTFKHGFGRFEMSGNNQTFTGSANFWILSKVDALDDSSSLTLFFSPSANIHVERGLIFKGVDDTEPLLLRSTSLGSSYYLNKQGGTTLLHVDVQDCDSSAGETMYPFLGISSGNNVNWNFEGRRRSVILFSGSMGY